MKSPYSFFHIPPFEAIFTNEAVLRKIINAKLASIFHLLSLNTLSFLKDYDPTVEWPKSICNPNKQRQPKALI